ncbi:MAG: hypothetical protein ACI957_002093 [Verrucomicrobiales bacterium]|jgi:hypothetical protein
MSSAVPIDDATGGEYALGFYAFDAVAPRELTECRDSIATRCASEARRVESSLTGGYDA